MDENRTTAAVQQYLVDLDGLRDDSPADPIIRDLLTRAVNRLRVLCASMLMRQYPRLMRPPLNLEPEELLGAVVERLLKAMRQVRPKTVRQFFAIANQHMRWELNDLARRLDERNLVVELDDSAVPAPLESSASQLSGNTRRMLEAIESLPDDEREAFSLVRIQGMTQPDAAAVLGVSAKTVQRRWNRARVLLADRLADLQPPSGPESAH